MYLIYNEVGKNERIYLRIFIIDIDDIKGTWKFPTKKYCKRIKREVFKNSTDKFCFICKRISRKIEKQLYFGLFVCFLFVVCQFLYVRQTLLSRISDGCIFHKIPSLRGNMETILNRLLLYNKTLVEYRLD